MSKSMDQIINYIRDILRKEGITGMESINHCIVFIICRMLDNTMCEKTQIDQKYTYENIMKDDEGNEIGDQELYNRIFKKGNPDCLIGQQVNKLGFKNIKFKLEGIQNLKNIMKKLEGFDPKLLSSKYDIIGTIYEIHLKSGTSNAMRDLGQYYTHRQVIDYMIKLCDPKMEKGVIEKILDPTMGTGGFLTMSIKYLNDKYKNKINWSKNKENIVGFDIDDNVRNMALLNIFLEMGELCENTIVKEDTLYRDLRFTNGTTLEKAKVILANEPMGLKNIIHASCCDRIKNLKIRGTKAEPLFLQLFMEALDDNGRCAVIVPDGMLFNESTLHQETRKYLVENFELKKVVALSDDFFLNTGVKTSIFYFEKNGQKTKEVEFSNIKLNKGEIEETIIIKVKYDDIEKNKYSLFINKYKKEKNEKISNIEYKKLAEICYLKNGKTITKNQCVEGDFPVIGGGKNPLGYHNVYYYDENTIVCSSSGANAGYISKYKTKIWASDCFSIKPKENSYLNNNYLYYYLMNIQNNIYELQKGSGQPHVYSSDIENIEIPIPSPDIQKKIVEQLDVLSSNIERSRQIIEEYRQIIKFYVDCNTINEKDIKISDIFEMVIGKKTTKEVMGNGDYDFYNGSANSPVGKYNEFSYSSEIPYILLIKDGGAGEGKYGDKIGLGKVFYVNGKTAFTTSVVALINKNNDINSKYAYYYLTTVKNNLMDMAQYTTGLGHLTTTRLKTFSIPIPTKEKQEEIVKYCDNVTMIIEQTEKQMEANKELIENIIDSYLNAQKKDTDNEQENVDELNDLDDEKIINSKKELNTETTKKVQKITVKEKKLNETGETLKFGNRVKKEDEEEIIIKPKKKTIQNSKEELL